MRRSQFSVFVFFLLTVIPVSADEISPKIIWKDQFLLTPAIEFQDKRYPLDTIRSDGYKLLKRLYEDDPELQLMISDAEIRGRFLTVYDVVISWMVGLDIANYFSGVPVTWTIGFLGAMMKVGEDYFFPTNHMAILKKSVELYNTKAAGRKEFVQPKSEDDLWEDSKPVSTNAQAKPTTPTPNLTK